MKSEKRLDGRLIRFVRYIRLATILAFLPGYLVMAWPEERWYLPLLALGMLVLGEWWERKTPFLFSPLLFLVFEIFLVACSGWGRSPFLFLFALAPGTYLLEGKLSGALWICCWNTIFFAILGGWALWQGDTFVMSYILGLVGTAWLLFFFLKEGQNTVTRRLLNLEKLADRDPLTGLGNRRALQRVVSTLIGQGTPFVLSIVDLDCFKECNDRYGHEKGDEVLQRFGTMLRFSVRQSDLVFRYGGDEFIVIFLGATPETVEEVLRRIEEKLKESSLKVGMSWGMASFPEEAKDRTQVFRLADERLYALKRERKSTRSGR